ncbi:MAG: Dabb family protein [Verrucomicrobiota bacterium]
MKLLFLALMSAALTSTCALATGEFRHAVFFKFKAKATPEQVQEIEQEFAGLSKKIPGITGYEWGTSESVEKLNDGFTHCFFVSFKDKAALEAYLPHDAHKAFGAKLRPLLEKAFVFDYTAKSE